MTPSSSEPPLDTQDDPREWAEDEWVDGEVIAVTTTVADGPVIDATEPRGTIERSRPSTTVVAARAAAVMTTGFVAGAIATVVVARKAGVEVRRRKRPAAGPAIAQSRRYLVDVHLLGDR